VDTAALAEGIAWADSVLAAWEGRGLKIPEHRYYIACANVLRIELKMDKTPHGVIKPVLKDWEAFKARLKGHKP